jgi:hypothetical protein
MPLGLAGIGGIIGGIGSLIGGTRQANALNNQSQQDNAHRQQIMKLLQGGFTGPQGSQSLSGQTLAHGTQRLFNETEGAQTNAATTAKNLFGEASGFSPSSSVLPTGFSLDNARGIIDKDNQLATNSIINPAIDRASTAEVRRAGGTSNFGSEGGALGQTMSNLRGANMIGGDKDALGLFNTQMDQFIKSSIGAGNDALAGATRPNQAIDLMNFGDFTNATNAISGLRPSAPVGDPTAELLFNAGGDVLSGIDARRRSDEVNKRLLAILERGAGNQQNNPLGPPASASIVAEAFRDR